MYPNSLILCLCSSVSEDQMESVSRSSFRWQSTDSTALLPFSRKTAHKNWVKMLQLSTRGQVSFSWRILTSTDTNFLTKLFFHSQWLLRRKFHMAESVIFISWKCILIRWTIQMKLKGIWGKKIKTVKTGSASLDKSMNKCLWHCVNFWIAFLLNLPFREMNPNLDPD